MFVNVGTQSKAPRGRIRKPMPNVAKADISCARSLAFGKKVRPMAAA